MQQLSKSLRPGAGAKKRLGKTQFARPVKTFNVLVSALRFNSLQLTTGKTALSSTIFPRSKKTSL